MLKTNEEMNVTCEVGGEEINGIAKAYSDDFYKYNYFADHPRNWFLEENEYNFQI